MKRSGQVVFLVCGLGAAALAAAALGLPSSDAVQLLAISFGVSLCVGLVGRGLLIGLRSARLAVQGMVVVFVAVGGTLAGALVAARAMFVSTHDLRALVVVMIGAATVAALAGLHLSREIGRASTDLGVIARRIGGGEADLEHGGPRRVPEELGRLGGELLDMKLRLDEARLRSQRVEQSRREVIAWVSHDLRTPLSRMRAMVEAINDGVVADGETVHRYHLAMQSEVERLGGLVDDLFELSRIQASALCLNLEPVIVADLVSDTLSSASVAAERKGVQLAGDVLDEEVMAQLSIPEMARVLHNLLDNAIRHSPPGGEVRVSVDSEGSDVVLTVSDQCGGIAEHDLERVFDLAYRGDAARSPADDTDVAPNGAGGLGLAIAKGFVEAHSGFIAVKNEGAGCIFTVNMPRWRPAPVLEAS
jgi:signal transduction histidine kinase